MPLKLEDIKTQLDETLKAVDNVNYNSEKFNDEARREIAERFVRWYFYLLAGSFIAPAIYNLVVYQISRDVNLFIPIKDVILLASSTISGSLGFIVGYYFKSGSTKIK